jgi:hypothetical protein
MTNIAVSIPFIILCFLGALRGIRIYSRTGLNAELVKIAGILILISSFSIDNSALAIIGFVVFNIGFIFEVTIENAFRKELFSQITFTDKLIGDVPRLQYGRTATTKYKYNKSIGLVTGLICLLLGLIYYQRLTKKEITDLIFPGLLAFAGIFFVAFSILQKEKK